LTRLENGIAKEGYFDATVISLDRLIDLPESDVGSLVLDSSKGKVRLDQLFAIQTSVTSGTTNLENRLNLCGDFSRFENLCSLTRSGLTTIEGNVGDGFARSQQGGVILVDGSVGANALVDKQEGLCVIRGDVSDGFGAPLPGKLQGLQGGDTIILGNLGNRACYRMRRGTVCVAGDIGEYLAHQWIAGTVVAKQNIGSCWAANMRRGSLILDCAPTTLSGATFSRPRALELSFLPILWNHLRDLLMQVSQAGEISDGFLVKVVAMLEAIPTSRRVLRRVGDRECEGQGEVLIIQK
jgi:formylmethanofuran dehydrogenase subunit C